MKQLLVAISLVLSASAAGASSYWKSHISSDDYAWDYENNQHAYETWLEEVDGNPSSWQLSKLNYIVKNYSKNFKLNGVWHNNKGTGTPDFSLNSSHQYLSLIHISEPTRPY